MACWVKYVCVLLERDARKHPFFLCTIFVENIYEKKKMLYIDRNKATATLHIPRNLTVLPAGGRWMLTLKNTLGRESTVLTITSSTHTAMWHIVNIRHNGLTSGEYQYHLICNGGLVASGLAMVTTSSEIEQNEQTMKYEQYE